MGVARPGDVNAAFADAFNRRDLDALLGLYDPDGAVVEMDGTTSTGTDQIRRHLERLLEDRVAAREVARRARHELVGRDALALEHGAVGPHRLPAHLTKLREADVIVVVAGMEGALPSVVGGYVDCPVIAVPTSVGYGANFGGLSALLGMLNSCAANVTVVNIDAGFKGGYIAGLIASRCGNPKGLC